MVHSGFTPALLSIRTAKEAHQRVYNGTSAAALNKSLVTPEMVAAAAAYEALQTYNRHRAKQAGHPPSRTTLEDLMTDFSVTAVDELFRTMGLDYLDKKRVRVLAAEGARRVADEKYLLDNGPALS